MFKVRNNGLLLCKRFGGTAHFHALERTYSSADTRQR